MHPSIDHDLAKFRQAELAEQAQRSLEAATSRRARRAARRSARRTARREPPTVADVVVISPRDVADDAA